MTSHRFWAGFVLIAAMGITSLTAAQPPEREVPEEEEKFDLNQRLNQRYGDFLQKRTELDLFRQILEGVKKNKTEADWKKFLESNPLLQNPQMLEKLGKLALDQSKNLGVNKLPQVEKLQKMLDQLKEQPKVPPVEPENPEQKAVDPIPNPMPPVPTPEQQKERIDRDPRTRDWMRWAEKNIGPLSDNPAIQDVLLEFANGDYGEWRNDLNEMLGDWKEYESEFRDLGSWFEKQVGSPSTWDLPSVDLGTPNIGFGAGGGGGSSAGSFGTSTGERELSWAPVIILGVLATGGLLYWWLRGLERRQEVIEPSIEERLGPWPVDPRAIRTAEQLVLAFEYLSLTQCGLETKTWNHRAIALELSTRFSGQGVRVTRLADLYEHARYAPSSSPLSHQDIELGRQELCHLIGVPLS